MFYKWTNVAALLCLLASGRAQAATSLLASVPTTGTVYNAVVSQGRLYAAEGAEGLAVYSLANPESPILLARYPTGAPALDLALRGQWLYVANEDQGIETFELLPDGSAASMGDSPLLWRAERVAAGDFGLAVSVAYDGIALLDLARPWAPALRNIVPVSDRVFGLAARGLELLSAEGRDGLAAYDLSDFSTPLLEWRIASPGTTIDAAWTDTGVLAAQGPDGFDAYASAPTGPPQRLGHVDGPAFALAADGSTAYVSAATVRVFRLAQDAPPIPLGDVDPPGAAVRLCVDGNLLAAAGLRDGISLFRIDPDALPREIGRVGLFGFARNLAIEDGLAAVAEGGVGVRLIDVSVPTAPSVRGLCVGLDPRDVRIHGSSVVAGDPGFGLITFDASDPTRPFPVATHSKTSGAAYGFDLSVDGTTAAIAAAPYGLKLTRAATGGGGLLGIADLYVETRDAALAANTAYAVGDGDGLVVYDVTDVSTPVEVSRLALPRARRIRLSADRSRAYVAGGEAGVFLIDLASPRSPRVLSNLPAFDARDFAPLGDRLGLVAEGPNGLGVADLTDPLHPRMLFHASPAPGDLLEGLAVSGPLAFLAYGDAGLVILSFESLLAAQASARSWTLFQ